MRVNSENSFSGSEQLLFEEPEHGKIYNKATRVLALRKLLKSCQIRILARHNTLRRFFPCSRFWSFPHETVLGNVHWSRIDCWKFHPQTICYLSQKRRDKKQSMKLQLTASWFIYFPYFLLTALDAISNDKLSFLFQSYCAKSCEAKAVKLQEMPISVDCEPRWKSSER